MKIILLCFEMMLCETDIIEFDYDLRVGAVKKFEAGI